MINKNNYKKGENKKMTYEYDISTSDYFTNEEKNARKKVVDDRYNELIAKWREHYNTLDWHELNKAHKGNIKKLYQNAGIYGMWINEMLIDANKVEGIKQSLKFMQEKAAKLTASTKAVNCRKHQWHMKYRRKLNEHIDAEFVYDANEEIKAEIKQELECDNLSHIQNKESMI